MKETTGYDPEEKDDNESYYWAEYMYLMAEMYDTLSFGSEEEREQSCDDGIREILEKYKGIDEKRGTINGLEIAAALYGQEAVIKYLERYEKQ